MSESSLAACEFLYWGCCVLAHKVTSGGRTCGVESYAVRGTKRSFTHSKISEGSSEESVKKQVCQDLLRAGAPYTFSAPEKCRCGGGVACD